MRKKLMILTLFVSVLLMAVGGTMAAKRNAPVLTGITAPVYVSGNAVMGARLQILDKDGMVVDEFVTTGEAFTKEAELNAGETYTLHEVEAPKGFYVADDIEFTVSEDGEWDSVEMVDAPTIVQIEKKEQESEKPLSGAVLQVIDKKGTVVDEWISDGTIHEIKGTLEAGATYRIHEVEAPDGYLRSEDMEFTVPSTRETKEMTFYNVKSTEPGQPQTGELMPIAMIGGGLLIALSGVIASVLTRKRAEQGIDGN